MIVTPTASVTDTIIAFHASWLAQFWNPEHVQAYLAFFNDTFQSFLRDNGITLKPVPTHLHHKNPLEPKHGFMWSIFLRLKHGNNDTNPRVLAYQAVKI